MGDISTVQTVRKDGLWTTLRVAQIYYLMVTAFTKLIADPSPRSERLAGP
jgi:hypothetical protein